MAEVFVYDALHTPLSPGLAEGTLYEVPPLDLVVQLLQHLKNRNQVELKSIQGLHLATTHPIYGQGGDLARIALLSAGYNPESTGHCHYGTETCGWGAIAAAHSMLSITGKAHWQLVGGVDSFSRLRALLPSDPWQTDLGQLSSGLVLPPGLAADLLATRYGLERTALDQFTAASQAKAESKKGTRINTHRIIPVCDANGLEIAVANEIPEDRIDPEKRQHAKPIFGLDGKKGLDSLAQDFFPELEQIHHEHTLFSTAPPADGASILLLGNQADNAGSMASPVARILALEITGGSIEDPFQGALMATHQALRKAGLTASAIETWACLENFAAVSLYFQQELKIPPDRFNEGGGELILGLAGGSAASLMISRLLSTMEINKRKIGLAALAGYTGLGGACIIEWLQ